MKDHSVVWIFGDTNTTSGTTQYWWRMCRSRCRCVRERDQRDATRPDGEQFVDLAVDNYLDDAMFSTTTKTTAPFWIDFITEVRTSRA